MKSKPLHTVFEIALWFSLFRNICVSTSRNITERKQISCLGVAEEKLGNMYQFLSTNEEITTFEVSKAVNINIIAFRDVTPCILEESCRYIGVGCCLHLRP
jgi:hypothetical protein